MEFVNEYPALNSEEFSEVNYLSLKYITKKNYKIELHNRYDIIESSSGINRNDDRRTKDPPVFTGAGI